MLFHSLTHVNRETILQVSGPDDPTMPEASAALLRAVPEFGERYMELVEQADGHPGEEEALSEFAAFVEELASGLEQFRPVLSRCFAAVEQVAGSSDDAEELVGWSFLDYLSIDARRAVLPWLGPNTLGVLEAIEDPNGG
jgi:hypothetical protein